MGGGGRDSLVRIAIGYELGGPGIAPQWSPDFSEPVQTGSGAQDLFTGGKAAGSWR
jgi:hypothetical protein